MPRNTGSIIFGLSVVLLLWPALGSAKPVCDSFDTRKAILDNAMNDGSNPLGRFAAMAANADFKTGSKAARAQTQSSEVPLYQLGQRIVTTATSKDKLTLKCSGALHATVGSTRATKEFDFTVQQASDGKLSVSVEPFQF